MGCRRWHTFCLSLFQLLVVVFTMPVDLGPYSKVKIVRMPEIKKVWYTYYKQCLQLEQVHISTNSTLPKSTYLKEAEVIGFFKRNRQCFLHAIKHQEVDTWLIGFYKRFLQRFSTFHLQPSDHLQEAQQRQLQVSSHPFWWVTQHLFRSYVQISFHWLTKTCYSRKVWTLTGRLWMQEKEQFCQRKKGLHELNRLADANLTLSNCRSNWLPLFSAASLQHTCNKLRPRSTAWQIDPYYIMYVSPKKWSESNWNQHRKVVRISAVSRDSFVRITCDWLFFFICLAGNLKTLVAS